MSYNIRTIYFDSLSQAERVLADMKAMLELYGVVTVRDYYDLTGYAICQRDERYGWVNLDGVIVKTEFVDDIYINLPKPLFLSDVEEKKPDMVNHPPHYQSESGLEVIDVIEAFTFDLKGIEATDTGNVLKYMCRWKGKNGLQDLEKAKWYLEHLIAHVKKLEE